MSNKNNKWTYIPSSCSRTRNYNLMDLGQYNGPRKNLSNLIRNITIDDVKYSLRLNDISAEIPENFSWREKGKLSEPRDQRQCGSCWAFSIASCLADRYSIFYNVKCPNLSPLWLLSNISNMLPSENISPNIVCDTGGSVYFGCKWLENNNYIKTESCWPYNILLSHNNVCPEQLPTECCYCCGDLTEKDNNLFFKVKPNSTKNLVIITNNKVNEEQTILSIQKEIMSNGPVITGFDVYDDFEKYWNFEASKGNIYIKDINSTNNLGGHAVIVCGWGTKIINGKKIRYWEIKNSWGSYSGDGGYCKIAFSTDVATNKILKLDIPLLYNNTLNGGMITMIPEKNSNLIQPVTPIPFPTPAPTPAPIPVLPPVTPAPTPTPVLPDITTPTPTPTVPDIAPSPPPVITPPAPTIPPVTDAPIKDSGNIFNKISNILVDFSTNNQYKIIFFIILIILILLL